MKDIPRFAQLQCAAYIYTQPDNLFLGQNTFPQHAVQRNKHFHPDINQIPDGICSADQFVVLNADDIRRPFQLFHQLNLRNILPGHVIIIALALGRAVAFRPQRIRFRFGGGNRYDFNGSLDSGMILPDSPVNCRISAGSKSSVNIPVCCPAFRQLYIFLSAAVHAFPLPPFPVCFLFFSDRPLSYKMIPLSYPCRNVFTGRQVRIPA